MSHTQTLARFVRGLCFEDLPPQVVDSAKRHLLDVVGVGLLGAQQLMPQNALRGIVVMPGSGGRVQVWGSDRTLAAPYAAMANGMACHVLDFDDTHTLGIVHGSAILAPLLLALGEDHDLSGSQLLTAFVAGWEVAARVGAAARGTIQQRGYHTTAIAGIFGAAAAAGKVLGHSEEQLVHAMGLAGSQAAGINEYQINGSSSKILHTGWAAYSGIVAAYLAGAGMTGPLTVFEGAAGILATHGDRQRSEPSELVKDLGSVWEITRVSIKPYPCCHFLHGFIDCALQLRRHGVSVSDIEEIEAVVPEVEVPFICEPAALRERPVTAYIAKFSLPLTVSAALIDGTIGHETFTDAYLARTDVRELSSRVKYRVAAPGETTFPKYYPGWLRMRVRDGRLLEQKLDINWGAPENPMSRDAVERKFRDNARGILSSRAIEGLLDAVASLDHANSGSLGKLLGRAGAERKTA
jgi:2-methylcitrate dehydratase PrpD